VALGLILKCKNENTNYWKPEHHQDVAMGPYITGVEESKTGTKKSQR